MSTESRELEILQYYARGAICNQMHDKVIIEVLINLGYLRRSINSNLEETMRTTDYGLLYLDLFGVPVDAPAIEGGRIAITGVRMQKEVRQVPFRF